MRQSRSDRDGFTTNNFLADSVLTRHMVDGRILDNIAPKSEWNTDTTTWCIDSVATLIERAKTPAEATGIKLIRKKIGGTQC